MGRILQGLKARGVLREPLRNVIQSYKRRVKPPCATRKPREYVVRHPGDLVHVDTQEVRPLPNMVIKQSIALDMVSRGPPWCSGQGDVLEAFRSATAGHARRFLATLIERSPCRVKAIRIDCKSEFQAAFEKACQEKGIRLLCCRPDRRSSMGKWNRRSSPIPRNSMIAILENWT